MTDVFSGAMPAVVTSAFATSYVAALGSANSAGRLGWAVASDKLGRKASDTLPLPASSASFLKECDDAVWRDVVRRNVRCDEMRCDDVM